MDHKHAIERILALEDACDVTAIRYKGLAIWPYIRLLLWSRMLNPGKFKPAPEVGLAVWSQMHAASFAQRENYAAFMRHYEQHLRNLVALRGHDAIDALFFSRVEDHADRFGGAYYNRHLDPMIDLARGRSSFLKLELTTAGAAQTVPRFEATQFLDSTDFVRYEARRGMIQAFASGEPVPGIEGIEGFFAELRRLEPGFPLTREQLYIEVEQLVQMRGYFRTMLSALGPKAVWTVCYYYDIAMALMAACADLGIVSVDVQHGKQGRFHGMYTHWQRMPAEGYALLPELFWCWGDDSREHIERWLPVGNHRHGVVVGGNRWLAKWANHDTDNLVLEEEDERALRRLDTSPKVVLVSLQPVNPILPTWLLEAIERSPASWSWMLRLHPLQREQLPACQETLRSRGLTQVDLQDATRLPLYALLQRAHAHVTQWSSVAYEALAFGVPSIVVGETAATMFQPDIRSRRLLHASDADGVLALLRGGADGPTYRAQPAYIETDNRLADEAYGSIMERAARRSKERIAGQEIA
ncbi:MAG: hypothetical protein R2834_14770 [Rhodothermales bacterium]